MKHEPDTTFVYEWLVETEGGTPDPVRGTEQVMARLMRTPQASRWWPVRVGPLSPRGAWSPGSRAAKMVAAATVAAVFGGAILLGLARLEGGDVRTPSAGSPSGAGQPAIHWQSGVVDLQADSVTLQVGEETYTTEGADVVVDSYDGNLKQWALYPRWVEDGDTFWMYFEFSSDGEYWRTSPWIWREGVVGPGDGEYEFWTGPGEPEYDPPNAFIEFPQSQIAMPLGEAYEGDWVLTDRLEVPTCDPETQEMVDVTMTFENLRLSVTPRQPTFIDELAYDWFHRGSMLGDIFRGHLEHPHSVLLECPAVSAE